MTARITHTNRSLKFETGRGSLEIIVDETGVTLDVFEEIEGADNSHIRAENLPLSFALEIRNFLDYALLGTPVEDSDDGHPERRMSGVGDRRTEAE